MSVIKLEIHVFYQKLYGETNIEHKEVSVENALLDRRSMKEIFKECKEMFPELSGRMSYIPKLVNLRTNRQKILIKSKSKSLSSLVEQNRAYCSKNNEITMMLYFFTVVPSNSKILSEFCVEFYVKVHFYNPNDHKLTVTVKKHFFTNLNLQKTVREITKFFMKLTVDESGEEVDRSVKEKACYHLLDNKGLKSINSNEFGLPVQQFVQRHRSDLSHHNKIIALIHAFYIEKVDQ